MHSGWKVAEAFPANGATADTNAAVLAALGEGVSALLIRVGSRVWRLTGSRRCCPGCI